MVDLIGTSFAQLDDTFSRTYGILYERNAQLFREFFTDIRDFYHWYPTNNALI